MKGVIYTERGRGAGAGFPARKRNLRFAVNGGPVDEACLVALLL